MFLSGPYILMLWSVVITPPESPVLILKVPL